MIERELKRFLLTVPAVKKAVGTHVYDSVVPTTESPTQAILLRRLSGDRSYGLFGEDTSAQPILQITFVSRHASGGVLLHNLSEAVRLALNAFAKEPGQMGTMWINSLMIVSEGVDLPLLPVASGMSWKRARSYDVQITHAQATETVT